MDVRQGALGTTLDYFQRALEERNAASVRVEQVRISRARAGHNAWELIARSIDPSTGNVQTIRLATWLADASKRHFEVAAQAYAALEAQLLARGPGDVARFNQDIVEKLRDAPARSAPSAAGPGRVHRGERLLVENPILLMQWDATASTSTTPGGFISSLRSLLENHGIPVAPALHPVPPGSRGAVIDVPVNDRAALSLLNRNPAP